MFRVHRKTKTTRSGVDISNALRVLPKSFSAGAERDPVVVYKKYHEKRSENMMTDEAPHHSGINYTELVQVSAHEC